MNRKENDTRKPPEARSALTLPPMSRGLQGLSVLLFFLMGVVLTYVILSNPLQIPFLGGGAAEPPETARPAAAVRSLYQCPMHPEVLEEEPGNCPICGMALQEVAPSGAGRSGAPLRIDPVQVQNIGLVSVPARTADLAREVRAVGILDFDANGITWVNVKFSGWVEKVHVSYVGEQVEAGDPLFEIYSPDLVTTQEEYLRALDYVDSLRDSARPEARQQAEALLGATRERLGYWDISEEQIRALEARRTVQRLLTIVSPETGVVAEMARESLEGVFVQPGMNLYRIADLSSVWAHADIYEQDMPWIRAGQPARVTLGYDLGRVYESQVLFLYPEVSQETRTVKICVEIPNPDGKLRPGMYANVVLEGETVRDAVVIPRSAILYSGERTLVFVALGEGRFEPREIRAGVTGRGDLVQVLHGVASGEPVVTQAQFMLDSESHMQEAIAKFLRRDGGGAGERP